MPEKLLFDVNKNLHKSLALAHRRCRTTEMYAFLHQSDDPDLVWQVYVSQRIQLTKNQPQSPLDLDQRDGFQHLAYCPYDPAFRVTGHLNYSPEPVG